MNGDIFRGRAGLQQRVIPAYRAAFIEALAGACAGGLSVFAGEPLRDEGIILADRLKNVRFQFAENRYFRSPGTSLFLCWQGGFLEWLQEWQPDILIVEANPRYLATRLAISWMHRRGRKVIGWGLGAPPLSGRIARLRQWERMSLLHSLDAVIAYSRQGSEQYRSLGIPAEKVYVAPNATAPAPTSPPPQRAAQFVGKPVILFVGRLQERKRIDYLIKACANLPVEIQPRLVIVGDGPARSNLMQLAQISSLEVEFAGAKQGAELEPYYAQADLFVLPGTGGLAIQQAMAHALPVIVAKGDGTQDDLVHPENGWQVPPDDLQSLTSALNQALSDPVRLRQMGLASYRIVAEEINIDRMVAVFIQAMNTLRSNP